MAEEKYNSLPEFLNDFAGALQKLYPDTPENQDEDGNWKYEQIYPIGNADHEGFADLIAPEKYAELKPENIVNGVTVFGVEGEADIDAPEPTFRSSSLKGYVEATCGEKHVSSSNVMKIFYGTLSKPSTDETTITSSIRYGTTILGYTGKYLGIPHCKVTINKGNYSGSYTTKFVYFPSEDTLTYPDVTQSEVTFTTYVGSVITITGTNISLTAYATAEGDDGKKGLPVGRTVSGSSYTWEVVIPHFNEYTIKSVTITLS